jgi:2-iminobutanoate/2-iminopropanoate deaminase
VIWDLSWQRQEITGSKKESAMQETVTSKQAVSTDKAPRPVAPYSQAIKYGNLVFVSGQLGLNRETGKLESDVRDQTFAALTHVKNILAAAGSGMECVVKTTVYLANMDDFPVVNEVYATFFGTVPPARAAIQVAKLPLGGLVEIEAVAHVKEPRQLSREDL